MISREKTRGGGTNKKEITNYVGKLSKSGSLVRVLFIRLPYSIGDPKKGPYF